MSIDNLAVVELRHQNLKPKRRELLSEMNRFSVFIVWNKILLDSSSGTKGLCEGSLK